MSIDPGSSPPSQAVVQITMGRIYDVVTETRQEVRDLTTSMKGVVEHVGDHEARIRVVEHSGATTEDLEKVATRVRSLERWRWSSAGAIAVISGGAAAAATYFSARH